jgi:hypothetical protein
MPDGREVANMKSLVALACAGWLAVPGADPPSVAPLAFGMTPQDAATALGAPLTYHHGRPGSEVFAATYPAAIPGFYRVDTRIFLQFRRGCLTGWKRDWSRPPRGLF